VVDLRRASESDETRQWSQWQRCRFKRSRALAGDPARGGAGLNLFSNPERLSTTFDPILLSADGATARSRCEGSRIMERRICQLVKRRVLPNAQSPSLHSI